MYAKLFASIYQGTLRGNTNALAVFTNMLAHADQAGWVDMHPRAISEEVGLTVEQVKAAILELESADPESRSPEEDGRRILRLDEHRAWGWRIVNHAKYRAIRSEEDRREQNRLAQAKFRAKNKQSKPPSAAHKPPSYGSAHTEAEADTEASSPSEKKARKRAPPCPEGVNCQVWEDWLALRKAKRAPVSATTLEGAIVEAAKAHMTLDAFLRVWCRRGSQGLEAAWLKPEERASGETPWQRSQRERVEEMAPGVARKAPQTKETIDALPVAIRLG